MSARLPAVVYVRCTAAEAAAWADAADADGRSVSAWVRARIAESMRGRQLGALEPIPIPKRSKP